MANEHIINLPCGTKIRVAPWAANIGVDIVVKEDDVDIVVQEDDSDNQSVFAQCHDCGENIVGAEVRIAISRKSYAALRDLFTKLADGVPLDTMGATTGDEDDDE